MRRRLRRRPSPAAPVNDAVNNPVNDAAPASRDRRNAETLLEAGIFDREFYQAQSDQTFETDLAAAEHYAARSRGQFSPHPLLELAYFGNWFLHRLKTDQGVGVLIEHLQSKAPDRALGSLFDARELDVDPALVAAHPGGVLGYFLEHHGPDAPLPGRPEMTLNRARPHLLEAARTHIANAPRPRPRVKDSWDADLEDRWRARWAQTAPPETDGPSVSVIMPVRNRAGLVSAAVESVRRQTLQSWELIVVDDGSTDATPEVLDALAAEDPRIRVVRQAWGGVCAARNAGLAAAVAPIVAFLDSDNAWRPDFLLTGLSGMRGMGLRAAYAAQKLNDGGEVTYRAFAGDLDDLMIANHIDLNVMLVETDLAREVGGFDENLRRWVDHDFAIRIAQKTALKLMPFIGVEYDDSREVADRITTTEADSWQFVVLAKHWVRWDQVRATMDQRVPGRVSVVIPTWNDCRMTIRAARTLVRNSAGADLEVVIVDNGSKPATSLSLETGTFDLPQVRLERVTRNLNFATGSNLGFARSTGEFVVFLNNDTEPRPGWLRPLLEPLADPDVLGTQPLLQYPDDSVQACGTAFPVEGFLPVHLFASHPPEDALAMSDRRFAVVTAAALAMRASDVVALEGFDPIFVNGMEDIDLCLRARERRPGGHFLMVPESRVTHYEGRTEGRSDNISVNRRIFMERWRGRLPGAEVWRWEERGFAIDRTYGDGVEVPAPQLLLSRAAGRPGGEVPLRWGIRNPAIGGEVGDLWGDTHFIASLATSLEKLGQEVVTHRHGAHSLPPTAFDDVALGIRGLDEIAVVPGQINVLWVISQPDLVTARELADFDLVYAASPAWAKQMSERAGREVGVLLQATDLSLRADMTKPVGDGSRPVFVGGAPRDRVRPVVAAAIAAGVDVDVHGPFWDNKIPAANWSGTYVDNHELMQLYRDHGLVLADHHQDMREHGFLANRLFDAVASGARVVSDSVDGVELFGGAVQSFHDQDDLALLCSEAGRSRFPDDSEMTRIADRIAAEHSFDARAATLLADVSRVWSERKG